MHRALKRVATIFGLYIVFVVLFESVFLGYLQPSFERQGGGIPMLEIVTTDEAGNLSKRRLARLRSSAGPLYVSAHHWTRGWYDDLVARPAVRVELGGVVEDYAAVVVTGDEFDRVVAEFPIPLFMRFLMGFPIGRDIVRLDPVKHGAGRS